MLIEFNLKNISEVFSVTYKTMSLSQRENKTVFKAIDMDTCAAAAVQKLITEQQCPCPDQTVQPGASCSKLTMSLVIGRFQSIKTGVLLVFSFITGDKTEFLSPTNT